MRRSLCSCVAGQGCDTVCGRSPGRASGTRCRALRTSVAVPVPVPGASRDAHLSPSVGSEVSLWDPVGLSGLLLTLTPIRTPLPQRPLLPGPTRLGTPEDADVATSGGRRAGRGGDPQGRSSGGRPPSKRGTTGPFKLRTTTLRGREDKRRPLGPQRVTLPRVLLRKLFEVSFLEP